MLRAFVDNFALQREISCIVGKKLVECEKLLNELVDSNIRFINTGGKYVINAGGKRIRPIILLLVSNMLGIDSDEEVTYAAVIELIHTATLLHDDVIDQASIRRGLKTAHKKWGNTKTILLGDWLYATAMEQSLKFGNIEAVKILSKATLRMVEGEILALELIFKPTLPVEDYFDLISKKTAHLFVSACELPAVIKGLNLNYKKMLASYGYNLGICFQLVDDLLNVVGNSRTQGKPVLSDLKEGKLTLPIILLQKRCAKSRKIVQDMFATRDFSDEYLVEIQERVHDLNIDKEILSIAESFASKAVEAIKDFPGNKAKEVLESAPQILLKRRY